MNTGYVTNYKFSSEFYTAKKLVQCRSNLTFLRDCKRQGVIPKGLRTKNLLANTINSNKAVLLTQAQNRQWLHLTIDTEYRRLYALISNAVFPLNKYENEHLEIFSTQLQRTKAKKLLSLTHRNNTTVNAPQGFSNITSHSLSENTTSLLNKGVSYIPPQYSRQQLNKKIIESLSDIEICSSKLAAKNVNRDIIQEFSGGLSNIIKKTKPKTSTKDYREMKKEIESYEDMVIIPTDKSNRLMAIDKKTYEDMLDEATIKSGNFEKVRHVKPITRQQNFNKALFSLISKYRGNQPDSYKFFMNLSCSDPAISSPYVLPKDHKEGRLKGRPIIAALDGPATKLAKALSSKLNGLMSEIPAHLNSCDEFVEWISSFRDRNIKGFASLDVTNLYGNIPRTDGDRDHSIYSVLSDFFNQHKHLEPVLRGLETEDFIAIVQLALNNDFVLYKEECYRQINGLSMGNPLAPQLAIIYMNTVESNILNSIRKDIHWKRYIDDCFVFWEDDITAEEILETANKVSDNIQFTLEKPKKGKLPFLDCEVSVSNGRFLTKLYSKEIHSGIIFPWDSISPISLKKGILLGELRRAEARSNNANSVRDSICKVKERFRRNGYPENFLRRTEWEYNRKKMHVTNQTTSKSEYIYIKCPYTDEIQKRQCMSVIRRTNLGDKVRLWFDSGKKLKEIFHPPKERLCCPAACETCKLSNKPNLCSLKNIIYEIECKLCSQLYIGETGRSAGTRIKEHISGSHPSAVKDHFRNSHNLLDFSGSVSWRILHRGVASGHKRKSIEAIYIGRSDKSSLMNGCIGRDLQYIS